MFAQSFKHKALLASALMISLAGMTAPLRAEVDYQKLVEEAHARFKNNNEGANANYIPVWMR